MKSLSVKLKVMFFIIGLIIFCYAEVWGADWKFSKEEIDKDDDGSTFRTVYYHDQESVERSSKGIVKVYVKAVDQRDKISWKEMEKRIDKSFEKDWENVQQKRKSRGAQDYYDKTSYRWDVESANAPICTKYIITLYEFNCLERTSCELEWQSYDKEGVQLRGGQTDPGIIQMKTERIYPESQIEKLYKKVCR